MTPSTQISTRFADAARATAVEASDPPPSAPESGPETSRTATNGAAGATQRGLVVRVDAAGACTLREAVDRALSNYFADLGDAPASNLYALVLREVERPLLELTLARCDGNQSRAADALGIHRGTLRKKLREHGIL